jgi:hypothetical protein
VARAFPTIHKRPGFPLIYAIDALAQRWHVHPSVVENDPVWMWRGLVFMDLESQATPRKDN